MNILYLGDIVGAPGRQLIADNLSNIRVKYDLDIVIAQAENVSHGKGLSTSHYNELRSHGVDGFTGGNHTFERPDTMRLVADAGRAVTAPFNTLGRHFPIYKLISSPAGNVLVASIMGTVYPDKANDMFTNSLEAADEIVKIIDATQPVASIVNIHGDLSSQKVVMGHYLDGKVTAVVGDHWHTPTADCRVLPAGTAHITDVGMCGKLDASLGAKYEDVISWWKTGKKTKLNIELTGPSQINGVIVEVNPENGLALSIQQLRIIIEE